LQSLEVGNVLSRRNEIGGRPMKITVEIADHLLNEARNFAARKGMTLPSLIEEGLHRVLADTQQNPKFRLRDASVGGNGLRPELHGVSWDDIRAMSYERDEE
jgi:hypothetical protein